MSDHTALMEALNESHARLHALLINAGAPHARDHETTCTERPEGDE